MGIVFLFLNVIVLFVWTKQKDKILMSICRIILEEKGRKTFSSDTTTILNYKKKRSANLISHRNFTMLNKNLELKTKTSIDLKSD